jgi:3',5'-cyclic AMP phosphodiesterase CpdA
MRNLKICFILSVLLIVFYSAVYAAEPFRFALFSDLHISTKNQIAGLDLQLAVKDVCDLNGIDFVIISGDITQNGDTDSFIEAKQKLNQLTMPFYILPGNHDFRWNVGDGATEFVKVFGDDKFSFTHKNFLFIGFTTVPLTKSDNASFDKNDFKWIKKQLKSSGSKTPFFAITHYPLLMTNVDDCKKMTSLFTKYNIQAILNGHLHRNGCLDYDGIPGIVNRSTLRNKSPYGAYSIYSISDSLRVFEKSIGQPESLWLTLPLKKAE